MPALSRFACAAFLCFTLAGCSTFIESSRWEGRLDDRTAVYSWSARGSMRFVCSYDKAGPYWQAIGAKAALVDDANQATAALSHENVIRARDGSSISVSVIAAADATTAKDLRPALFDVEHSSSSGMLRGIRFVERRNAEGGMPLAPCSPAQRGQRLDVPFTARFIFWR